MLKFVNLEEPICWSQRVKAMKFEGFQFLVFPASKS